MAKTPEEYRSRYNLEPVTLEGIQEDIKRFDTHLAQQVMHNIHNQQANHNSFHRGGGGGGRGGGGGGRGGRGRGRGRPPFRDQGFRPRGHFPPQYAPPYNPGNDNEG